jgi:probable addiction module antidote protein
MRKTTTTQYDVAEHLRTPEEMAAYLEACFEDANGDAAFIAKALGDIARAKGMARVARDAGLSRESLYKALSGERSPGFDTILKVIGALGLKLQARVPRGPGSRPSGRTAKRRVA